MDTSVTLTPSSLVQADSGMEKVSAPELSVEEVWSGAEGPPSIADLALEQKAIYYPLVQHHWLLTSLLHATMTFKVKGKPLSLFDSKVSTDSHLLVGSIYLCLFTATMAPSSLWFELQMTKGHFSSTEELKKWDLQTCENSRQRRFFAVFSGGI